MPSKISSFHIRLLLILLGLLVTGLVMWQLGPNETLDVRYYYTEQEARNFLMSLNSEQRAKYIQNEILDFVFITFYSSALVLWARRYLSGGRWRLGLALLPGLFDFLETGLILSALLSVGPEGGLRILGLLTFCKWSSGGAALIYLVFSLVKQRHSDTKG